MWPLPKSSRLRISILRFYLFLSIFVFVTNQGFGQAPILDDKAAIDSLRKATEHIYNGNFDQSELIMSRLRSRYHPHPALILLGCISSFWKHFPINSKPKEFDAYLKNLQFVVDLSEKMQVRYPKSPEPIFYQMMANLILARHHSESGEYIKAVNETRKAYPLIKKGFSLKANYSDFYFSTGLFNYYREVFPENHPMYKPFTIFFPQGNKALGIKELEIASQKAIFCRGEAFIFLGIIHMRDLYQVPAATKYATQLHETFPGNWLFSMTYAECLIESKKFEQAEPIVTKLLGRSETTALQTGFYLKGLMEVGENKEESAKASFLKSIQYGKSKDRMTKGYLGLCYNELGKMAKAEGRTEQAKKLFKLALENCVFKKVRDDAKRAGYL